MSWPRLHHAVFYITLTSPDQSVKETHAYEIKIIEDCPPHRLFQMASTRRNCRLRAHGSHGFRTCRDAGPRATQSDLQSVHDDQLRHMVRPRGGGFLAPRPDPPPGLCGTHPPPPHAPPPRS